MSTVNNEPGGSYGGAGINQEQPGTSARQQLREMKDQVVDQAKSSLREAKDRASSSLGESQGQFARQIGAVADAFRRTSEHLRSENQQRVAGLTESVARQADRVAEYVRDFDPRRARDDLESLARRQPAWVLGGAVALGLLGARFFKSSRRRDRRRDGRSEPGSYSGAERRLVRPPQTTYDLGETYARS
ncbi:MAG TPA: hypothetical protein VH763_02110 [Gemmatimonadales bacterium]|jgi:hypothetical protein